jgi:hypothetical protein
MKRIKPMGLTSTPFITYHEIDIKEIDLIEDAWGFNSGYSDVIAFLGEYKPAPGDQLIKSLMWLIRETE